MAAVYCVKNVNLHLRSSENMQAKTGKENAQRYN